MKFAQILAVASVLGLSGVALAEGKKAAPAKKAVAAAHKCTNSKDAKWKAKGATADSAACQKEGGDTFDGKAIEAAPAAAPVAPAEGATK